MVALTIFIMQTLSSGVPREVVDVYLALGYSEC